MVVGADATVASVPPAVPPAPAGGASSAAEAQDALMRSTSARRAGTPRGRAAPPSDVGVGSPPAKRPAARVNAEVPPAPSREMTMQEVTHTLQHLMAQATHDTKWIDNT